MINDRQQANAAPITSGASMNYDNTSEGYWPRGYWQRAPQQIIEKIDAARATIETKQAALAQAGPNATMSVQQVLEVLSEALSLLTDIATQVKTIKDSTTAAEEREKRNRTRDLLLRVGAYTAGLALSILGAYSLGSYRTPASFALIAVGLAITVVFEILAARRDG